MCPVQWIIYLCRGTTCASFSLLVAICMDLPKAFDFLPHDIIVSKLAAYEI
jgi:hypothetical protein